MLRGLSRFLAGRDTPLLGQLPGALEPVVASLMGGVNRLPRPVTERLYALSGVAESVRPERLGDLRSEDLASWVVEHYPKRRYPVIFVGSSNGALVHLAAALGAPWLPQTLLVPVRRSGVDRDDPRGEMRAGTVPGEELLGANPGLELHHMHDPNQDRLMVAGMSYFRLKWQRLPQAYRRFLRECLEPGGVIVSVECDLTWPTTRVGPRHVFQFGALGGASAEEYHKGGERVSDFLRRYGAGRLGWDPPVADEVSAEAEWGFSPELLYDLYDVAEEGPGALHRLRFDHPERLSPAVADLYRSWYETRGLAANRLLAETFLLLEPWWALRSGSVPYWMAFNTMSSQESLQHYLDTSAPYDEIRLMLFSHGVDSIGLAGLDDWDQVLHRARKVGTFLGADRNAYPRDFATLARAHRDISRIRHRVPMSGRLSLEQAVGALNQHDKLTWQPA
jgi:hypothetical protein